MEITPWDDVDFLGRQVPDTMDWETLNYNPDRWKAFVQTGAFPE